MTVSKDETNMAAAYLIRHGAHRHVKERCKERALRLCVPVFGGKGGQEAP
jgi:hypothetical protein